MGNQRMAWSQCHPDGSLMLPVSYWYFEGVH